MAKHIRQIHKNAKDTAPKVSVIMPVYNAEAYVAQAIESILTQSYRNFEFIIVDDASTDGSWKIVSGYRKAYPRIIRAVRLMKNMNRGGDACANVAYRLSRGSYIARMDADDVARPDRLEKQVRYLDAHPETLLLGSQATVIDGKGKIIGNKNVPLTHEEMYESYFVFHPVIHPSVMLNRALLPRGKDLYAIRYSANNDLYTFFGFLKRGRFANLPDRLVFYRMHGANDSLTKPKERFLNTLKIRFGAVRRGYRPTAKSVLLTGMQTLAILVLPESVIIPLYMCMKGIAKPVVQFNRVFTKLPPAMAFLRNYVFSFL